VLGLLGILRSGQSYHRPPVISSEFLVFNEIGQIRVEQKEYKEGMEVTAALNLLWVVFSTVLRATIK